MKPVDLAYIRGEAAYLKSRDMPVTAATMCAMADEIEALRTEPADAVDALDSGPGPEITEWIERTRALLPPDEKGPADAV